MEDTFFEDDEHIFFDGDNIPKQSKLNDYSTTCCTYTIKQIRSVNIKGESGFYIDNKKIKLVGIVRTIHKLENSVSYTIEDGTGAIDVRVWEPNVYCDTLMDSNRYVSVYGRIYVLNNKLVTVTVHRIFVVEDPMEITLHLLECIYTHLVNGKAETVLGLFERKHSGSDNPNESIVKRAIHECSSNKGGAYIHTVVVQLQGVMQEEQIMKIISKLMNQNLVYKTFDNNHYALADGI
ncbi:uncharacterized protein EV154DRAFT_565859 [Mucor mucedo]|uniref:uncharacterized protein n=1 Tax=Mucor mucedo TaxID=29922 RepID=UPI0022208233|nr:uncharacterized protein EV154DRAFT_565859 [Mucor mucedo]KAI7888959.1 hypothetical protein EV154DRAFT_565859 [Mucor mucedo]